MSVIDALQTLSENITDLLRGEDGIFARLYSFEDGRSKYYSFDKKITIEGLKSADGVNAFCELIMQYSEEEDGIMPSHARKIADIMVEGFAIQGYGVVDCLKRFIEQKYFENNEKGKNQIFNEKDLESIAHYLLYHVREDWKNGRESSEKYFYIGSNLISNEALPDSFLEEDITTADDLIEWIEKSRNNKAGLLFIPKMAIKTLEETSEISEKLYKSVMKVMHSKLLTKKDQMSLIDLISNGDETAFNILANSVTYKLLDNDSCEYLLGFAKKKNINAYKFIQHALTSFNNAQTEEVIQLIKTGISNNFLESYSLANCLINDLPTEDRREIIDLAIDNTSKHYDPEFFENLFEKELLDDEQKEKLFQITRKFRESNNQLSDTITLESLKKTKTKREYVDPALLPERD